MTQPSRLYKPPEVRRKISETLKARTRPLVERFMERFVRGADDACWLWQGGIGLNGYGVLTVSKTRRVSAHRFSYEVFRGPIPKGLTIDHLCRVTACVNPAHLEAVTLEENSRRAAKRTDICPKGHPKDGIYTKEGRLPVRYCLECNRANARAQKDKRAGK